MIHNGAKKGQYRGESHLRNNLGAGSAVAPNPLLPPSTCLTSPNSLFFWDELNWAELNRGESNCPRRSCLTFTASNKQTFNMFCQTSWIFWNTLKQMVWPLPAGSSSWAGSDERQGDLHCRLGMRQPLPQRDHNHCDDDCVADGDDKERSSSLQIPQNYNHHGHHMIVSFI